MAENMIKPGEKPKGWFSRRFPTSEAHEDAKASYIATHLGDLRTGNDEGHHKRMTKDEVLRQRDVLDARLGKGVGAVKERARLAARLVEVS